MSRRTKKCANCAGTGTIVYWDYADNATTVGSAYDKPCYRCNGTGKEKTE